METPLPDCHSFCVSKIQQSYQFIAVKSKVAPIINWNNNIYEAVPAVQRRFSGHLPINPSALLF
jgi:hypothetical protein